MNTMLWHPTLAATIPEAYDLSALPYPLLASPKLDGVRALVQNGKVVSRNGQAFRNRAVQELYGRAEYEGLDGELIVGPPTAKNVFNRTTSAVANGGEDAYKEFMLKGVFFVFDRYAVGRAYMARWASLSRFTKMGKVRLVEQDVMQNSTQILRYEKRLLRAGYEGVMLRRQNAGEYMQKRSTLRECELVKLKRFDYGTAVIMAVYPLRHNTNIEKTATGRRSSKRLGVVEDEKLVGSALLVDKERVFEFTVNIAEDKLRHWKGWPTAIGRAVRYRYQNVGTGEQPRFPTATFEELDVK